MKKYRATRLGRELLKHRVQLAIMMKWPIDKKILRYLASYPDGRTYAQIKEHTLKEGRYKLGDKYRKRSIARLLKDKLIY